MNRRGSVSDLGFLFLMVMGGLLLYAWMGTGRYSKSPDTVGVALSTGEIDLSEQLDVSRLPDLVQKAWEEGLKGGKQKEELQKQVLQNITTRVQAISTIDLNGDGNVDPVMVVPEGDEEQMTYSFRVPDPKEVTTLPPLSDSEEWKRISEESAVELASVSVIPRAMEGKVKSMDIEARPSQAFYPNQPYYHSSFTSDLLRYMIIRDLFFRPYWYGPSFYGGYGWYSPTPVSRVASTRTVTSYSSGNSSWSRQKTDSGKIPEVSKSSALASQKSFSSARDVRSSGVQSGGFGRSASSSGATPAPKPSSSRTSSSGGFGRSSSSSSSSRGWFSSSSSGGGTRRGK